MTFRKRIVIFDIMESGNIVEYIDHQRIMCAVILEVKKQRLRLLTETDREVNLSASRLSHLSKMSLDIGLGRLKTVEALKEIANRRKELIDRVDIKELWEVLNSEKEWIDLSTMTEFCFPENQSYDHESAVVRAFFSNRFYFKFNHDRFFPYSEKQVKQLAAEKRKTQRKDRMISQGADWVKSIINNGGPQSRPEVDAQSEFLNILKSIYVNGKSSPHYQIGKAILEKAGIKNFDNIFPILVKAGVWSEDENIDLIRFGIVTEFTDEVNKYALKLLETAGSKWSAGESSERKDLSGLPVITIDGQSTLDYDDAISIEKTGDSFRLGVHIIDVGYYVRKGDLIDQAAFERGSSIYMPDQKISMLPSVLAEDYCSLKAGELRPAISTMINLNHSFDIIDYEIFPSLIKVKDQLTYYETNCIVDENKDMAILYAIAMKYRQYRLDKGAVQITLPDINVWLNDKNEISVNRVNRESPGRFLVSELMIMANWLMAGFLAERDTPAIFRSQPPPRERLYKSDDGTLFQNCMQRRLLSRFALNHKPDHHAGLGLDAYVTATSPIRKYFDLVTQRQIRSILNLERPYTADEINEIIQMLEQPMSHVSRNQYLRNRYWLLKFLEKRIGSKEEAIVLFKRRNKYQILIPEYMIECELPISSGIDLKPEDLILITIQYVNARNDVLSVFMG